MSSTCRDWAWDQVAVSDLETADALIILCIADHADKLGKAWPSIGLIAKRTNLNPATVWRSITRLIAKQLLDRNRRGKSWTFTLHLTSCTAQDDIHDTSCTTQDETSCTTQDEAVDKSAEHIAPRKMNGGEHLAPRKRHLAPRKITSCTTQDRTLTEPSKNPSAPSGAAEAAAAASATSARDLLFSEGTKIVQGLLGVMDGTARNFLGKLLTVARDDCALVLAKLRQAEADQAAGILQLDARGWLMKACQPFRHGGLALLAEEGSSVRANEMAEAWERLNGRAIGHA